jgi:hypothetical protein
MFSKMALYTSSLYTLSTSPKIRVFFKNVCHNILATNYFLKKIKVIDDANCNFCQKENETIEHIFWGCENVQNLLGQVFMFSKMALYTSSLYTLSTSPKIRVFFKNVWFMSLSPNQEFTCPSNKFGLCVNFLQYNGDISSLRQMLELYPYGDKSSNLQTPFQ